MKIAKILNNNVLMTDNNYIITGRGIAFQKKIGQEIDKSKIEKFYQLSDSKASFLISDINEEVFHLTDLILRFAANILNRDLQNTNYIAIADHINNAIERAKQNAIIPLEIYDAQRFFAAEYQVGLEALHIIEQETGIKLPQQEASFLALHLIANDLEKSVNANKVMSLMQEILKIIKYSCQIEMNDESIHYSRFLTHLRFFVQRVLQNQYQKTVNDEDLNILIKNKHAKAYAVSTQVSNFLSENYQYTTSEDEKIYFTIHIARLVN